MAPYGLDDDLIEAVRRDGQPRARIGRCSGVSVVCGRGSKPERELHLDHVVADGVPVLRRAGGGCSVVLDPGNAIVSVVLRLPGLGGIKAAFDGISRWLAEGLRRAGVPGVRREGVSDLALEGRKIGGACIFRSRGLVYYATTLLVDPDIGLVERYLKHPPREPVYRAGRSHTAFMGCLRGYLGDNEIDPFLTRLTKKLQSVDWLAGPGSRLSPFPRLMHKSILEY